MASVAHVIAARKGTSIGVKKKAAVDVPRHQTEHDGGEPDPSAPHETTERQQRGQPGKPDEERHCVADRDPVGNVEQLDVGDEDVKPRTVIPKRKFDGLEVGAIGEAAGVPGQCLGAIVVGVELVDRKRIVRRGREADHEHRAQQRHGRDRLRIDCWPRRSII